METDRVLGNPPRLDASASRRGFFLPGGILNTTKVVVFFDWQNVYNRARDAFFDRTQDPHTAGQTDAVDLAEMLLKKARESRPDESLELEQVRIYRGRPTQQHDTKGYNAFQRQDGRWRRNNKIHTIYRDLKYPTDWGEIDCVEKPREKGIDVALAIDLVTLARDGAYDLAILMSADYDLLPAVDYVQFRHVVRGETPSIQVAAWKSDQTGRPLRLKSQSYSLWCHWLDRTDYYSAEDVTDYRLTATQRQIATGPTPGSWLR